jgi:PPM family protein phosphatase
LFTWIASVKRLGHSKYFRHFIEARSTVIELRAAGVTDAGRVRTANQDRFLIVADRIFVVADGMGGHRGGEVAAQMTVEALGVNTDSIQSTSDLVTRLEQTNQAVLDRSNEDPELRGMGTTVTAVALFKPEAKNPVVSIINVGDSRTYRMRAGELEQLTEDHSVVAELMRTGRLSPEEARGHRQRSVLTRAVGVEPTLEADTLEVLVNRGDRFMLCSDGLYSEVPDLRIAAVLRQLGDPNEASKELVRLALQNGGRDNVTVLIIDVLDDRDPSYAASKALVGETTFGGTPVESYEPAVKTPAANKPEPTTAKSTGSLDQTKKIKGGARKPWAVNLRVLLFVGLLAALGAVVAWVVTAGKDIPSDRRIPTPDSSTSIVETVTGSTVVGAAPAIPVQTLPNGDQLGVTIPGAIPASSVAGTQAGGTQAGEVQTPEGTTGISPTLVPPTLDPFDPAPKVKVKAKPKAKTKAKKKAKSTSNKSTSNKPAGNKSTGKKTVTPKVAPKKAPTKTIPKKAVAAKVAKSALSNHSIIRTQMIKAGINL